MIGSLYTGISGLNANSEAMTVIGDNIANVNTTGFKSSRASFANIFSQSLGGSTSNQIGRGVMMSGVSPLWTSGTVENTSNVTDLAINGRGLFVVNDSAGANYYTRAGEFRFDQNGNLVNPNNCTVQGYTLNADGTLGALGDITIPEGTVNPPQATSELSFGLNLDASAAENEEYSTTITVYDSLGNEVPLTVTFTKQATTPGSEWTVAASIPATAGTAATISVGSVTFDEDGVLSAPATDPSIELTLSNGADTPQTIDWNLYDPSGTNLGGLTGYSSPSSITSKTQDGYPAGMLRSISIDEEGVISGNYSNGQIRNLFQIAMADFSDYTGLAKMGDNLYSETRSSGQPSIGTAGNGSLGSLSPSSLEMSNVDLAQEFAKLITTQRAFQANSRVITTSDEILNELINIKR